MKAYAAMRNRLIGTDRTKFGRKVLPLILAVCFGSGASLANPVGPQVVNGQVTFANQGNIMLITNTPGSIINWQSFSINPGELTRFLQQNSSSSVLNRITGQDPTQILGALQSNGKVFLINPNGILFGQGAQVDVNGLVASTLNLSNTDFLAGKFNFSAGDKVGDIRNQGAITTPAGGQVYLLAANVDNSGIITSPKGDVMLAAGSSVQLMDSANPDMSVVVSAPTNQAVNLGQIIAQGGKIGIYGGLINQAGLVSANSAVIGENGKVVFKSSGDTLLDAGSVTSATGAGTGGEVQILGARVGLTGDAKVDASGQLGGGTVLVGGDYHGENAAIQNASRTYFGPSARIAADAIQSGDGGKVIVWSNDATRTYGSISARGGQQGGSGGFVETSGHYLDVAGIRVDAGASKGLPGTWLLDPYDIAVQIGGAATLSDVSLFSNPPVGAGTSTIDPSTINSATANVALQATNDITFTDAVNIAASGVALTARAGNNITVNNPITTNGGAITLSANDSGGPASGSGQLYLNDVVSSGGKTINLSGNSIELGGGVSSGGGAINVTASGSIDMDGSGTLDAGGAAGGVVTMHAAAGNIDIYNFIFAKKLALSASGNITVSGQDNDLTLGTVTSTNGDVSIDNSGANVHNLTVSGVISGASLALATGGGLVINSNLNAGNCIDCSGSVTLSSSTGAISGAGTVSASSLNSSSVLGTTLRTRVSSLTATNSGATGNISITNSVPLYVNSVQQTGLSSSGAVSINNTGALTVAGPVNTDSGGISLTAHSPLTINGLIQSTSGNITLSAGASGLVTDKLTINNDGSTTFGAISTGGSIALLAGDAIINSGTGNITGASVTYSPYLNTPPAPTLAQCIASPTLPGCSTVLPTLTTCIATPTTLGCSVVLPTLTACIANPLLAGCSVVLPTVTACVANPTLAGCSVVLPTLAACIANPALAGCSVVLPTLTACISDPSIAGCSVVLPTVASCTANPALAGCSVVLPTLAICISNPSLAGCSVVLPSLSACIANPTISGCSVVLPTLAQCAATPTLAGCSAVLPPLSACIVDPTSAGCTVVLPPIDTCVTNPAALGCKVVLPPLQTIKPIVDIINSTINIILTGGGTNDPIKQGLPVAGTTGVPGFDQPGATQNDPAKKLYCN